MNDVQYLREEAQRCRAAAAAVPDAAAAAKLQTVASELDSLAAALRRELARADPSADLAW